MFIGTKSAPCLALTAFMLFVPSIGQAQDARLRLSFAPAVATVDGNAELALGGSAGYRFSEHFWFDGDLTWIDAAAGGFRGRDLRLDFGRPPGKFRHSGFGDGSTLVATMGLRYELPVETDRFRPYVVGGLGLNYTTQEIRFVVTPYEDDIDDSLSHTGYAFTAGAGAAIRIVGPLWGDVDARYLRLSQDRDVMRLGGGVSVRF
jgi:opacity protein-like surface antigen